MIDRTGLAGFLRRRRESLQPEDVGLPRARVVVPTACGARRSRPCATCRPTTTPGSSASAARSRRSRCSPPSLRACTSPWTSATTCSGWRGTSRRRGGRAASTSARASCGSSTGSGTPRPRSSPSSARPSGRPRPRSRCSVTRALVRPLTQQRLPLVHRPCDPRAPRGGGPRLPLAHVRRRSARDRDRAGPGIASRGAGEPAAGAQRGVPLVVGRPRGGDPPARGQALPAPRGRTARAALPAAARPAAVAPADGLHGRAGLGEPREAPDARGDRRPEPLRT